MINISKRFKGLKSTPSKKSAATLQGYLDDYDGHAVRGWAFQGDVEPVRLDILIDDRVVASLLADEYRADLEAVGVGKGYHGFSYSFPSALLDNKEHELRIVFSATGTDLHGSPYRVVLASPEISVMGTQVRARLQSGIFPIVGNTLSGWVHDPDRPKERLWVQVVRKQRGGRSEELANLRANLPRKLDDSQENAVECGFQLRLPIGEDASSIFVYETSSGTLLSGCPVHCGVAPCLEGYVEGVTDSVLQGWAWGGRREMHLALDVLIDGVEAGTAFAVDHREDLHEAGIGDGTHGFSFHIPSKFQDNQEHDVEVRFRDTGALLPGCPVSVKLPEFGSIDAEASAGSFFIGADGFLCGALPASSDEASLPFGLASDEGIFATVRANRAQGARDLFEFKVPVPSDGSITVFPSARKIGAPAVRLTETEAPLHFECRETTERERQVLEVLEKLPERRRLKFMIPVWGEPYIKQFMELCLPSLLSRNNIPALIENFPDFEVFFLTRNDDMPRIRSYPAFAKLSRYCRVTEIAIDDILERFFTPAPNRIYPVALTHAFFRGIKHCGASATETDFIFWNGDFLAADGAFATLADSIAKGYRCTMAPSLRLDSAMTSELLWFLEKDGATLAIPPRDLVQIALDHPHPTVLAKTINNTTGTTIENINQFYMKIGKDKLVARSFLMFMLHIRPEHVGEEPYGFCDYAFVPDMVVHGRTNYVTSSDDLFIAELQDAEREANFISSGPLDVLDAARTIDYWATAEHVEASRRLLEFKGKGSHTRDDQDAIEEAEKALEHVLDQIYDRLAPKRPWHNQHIYWRDAYRILDPDPFPGYEQPPAPPSVNRDEPTRQTRWTGYDINLLRCSWIKPPVNLENLYFSPPHLTTEKAGEIMHWLDDLFDTYVSAWLLGESPMRDDFEACLTSYEVHTSGLELQYQTQFAGCRWGFCEFINGSWYRPLGPGGVGILLHHVSQRSDYTITLKGVVLNGATTRDLDIYINGQALDGRIDTKSGQSFSIQLVVRRDQVVSCGGRLVIAVVHKKSTREHVFAFSSYAVSANDKSAESDADDTDRPCATDVLPGQWPLPLLTSDVERALSEAKPARSLHFDADTGFIATGWRPPFRCFNRFFRWHTCTEEMVFARVEPGHTYRFILQVNRVLSCTDLVFGTELYVNGTSISELEVTASNDVYILACEIPRPCVELYDGFLAIQISHPMALDNTSSGFGRVEFAEPELGALAVECISIAALPEHNGSTVDAVCEHTKTERLGDFLSKYLAATPLPTRRERVCEALGFNYADYRSLVTTSTSPRVKAAWQALPIATETDGEAGLRWLAGVDAALAADMSTAAGAGGNLAPVAVFIGYTPSSPSGSGNGRMLPNSGRGRCKAIMKIDRRRGWICRTTLAEAGGEVRSFDVPIPAVGADGDMAVDAVALSVPSRDALGLKGDWSIGEIEMIPASAEAAMQRTDAWQVGGVETVPLIEEMTGRFGDVAARMSIDPKLHFSNYDASAFTHIQSVISAFGSSAASGEETERSLLRYLNQFVIRNCRPNAQWDGDTCRVDFSVPVAGVNWSPAHSHGSDVARSIGGSGSALVLVDVPAAGDVDLCFGIANGFAKACLGRLKLAVNGVPVDLSITPAGKGSEAKARFRVPKAGRLTLELGQSTNISLGFSGLVLHLQDTGSASETLPLVPVSTDVMLASPLLDFPTDIEELDRVAELVEIPASDLLLWRYGRDAATYAVLAHRLAQDCATVLDNPPPGEERPTEHTQVWLDLLDDTLAEGIVKVDPQTLADVTPDFDAGIGLGWGPLRTDEEGTYREFSFADEAVLFVPPRATPYAVRIRLTRQVPRETLLALQVTVNRKKPDESKLVFTSTGPELHLRVTWEQTDYGLGWAAIRLQIGGAQWNEIGVMFRPLADVGSRRSAVAVRGIDILPEMEQTPYRPQSGTHVPCSSIGVVSSPTDPDEKSGALAASEKTLPTAIYCVIPVWGEAYVRTFLDVVLPTHLTRGNLGALGGVPIIYEIYTDEAGRAAVEADHLYPLLQRMAQEVQFYDIRQLRYEERTHHQLTLNYSVMNKAHQRSIARAAATGGALLFLNSDTIYSEAVFTRVWELCKAGYRSVENLSIRTDRDQMLEAIMPYRSADGLLSMSSGDMSRIALKNLHWIAKGRFWNGSPDLTIPDNVYWHVGESAIVARATHYMPLFVFPRLRKVTYHGTIDHGFVPASGVLPDEIWRFESDEEPSSWELSLSSHDQYFPPYERGSVRDFSRFLSIQCDAVHIRNFMRPVRIAADPVPEERWTAVIEESDAILESVREELQHYSLTPWRPDATTRPDGSLAARRKKGSCS